MTTLREKTGHESIADLLERLGGIAPSRLRLKPPPGTATESDLSDDRPTCELVEGSLVEKALGFRESVLAVGISTALSNYAVPRRRGLVSGADAVLRLIPGIARAPDVAFCSWARMPGGKIPREAYPALVPDLAVEVLSAGNTPGEMARKRREYFQAGVRVVWEVDPRTRTVSVYKEARAPMRILTEGETLEGGRFLPGFSLPLRGLFAQIDDLPE